MALPKPGYQPGFGRKLDRSRLPMPNRISIVLLVFFLLGSNDLSATTHQKADGAWFVNAIATPSELKLKKNQRPIVIAVVDDGMRNSHQDLRAFLWRNVMEVPGNGIDDDGNGYRDDVHGWDVADDDAIVEPPRHHEAYYHGTHVAGILSQIIRYSYGDLAPEVIRILPIKSLSDQADTTLLVDAYAGFEYAIDSGADIILCAWGMATITSEQARLLDLAEQKGILVVASVGNFPEEREQYPAAHKTVLAVAGVDREGRKSPASNFGEFVDLVAPAVDIRSADIKNDDAYAHKDGTSAGAAMVAAAAALVSVHQPDLSLPEIRACLIDAALSPKIGEIKYRGKLGAGLLNVSGAVACNVRNGSVGENLIDRTEGYLRPAPSPKGRVSWQIEPIGEFNGIRFRPVFNRNQKAKGKLEFRTGRSPDARVIGRYDLSDVPESIHVAGKTAYVVFEPESRFRKFDWLMSFEVATIDFKNRYCRETVELDEPGTLVDGSGPENYSFDSDCKWLITAPAGKKIQFRFTEFDTEGRTDMIYFFNGAGTHEKIMAIFSGTELPPELTTWSNQVLVWFVTNGSVEGRGWQADYQFVDP